MSTTSVERILQEIEALTDEERLALDEQLVRKYHREWEQEMQAMRKEARRRGIDQTAIDKAVDRQRYGQ